MNALQLFKNRMGIQSIVFEMFSNKDFSESALYYVDINLKPIYF